MDRQGDYYNDAFATNLRDLIDSQGLTKSDIATKIGVSKETLYSYYYGRTQPRLDPLCWVADYFEVSLDWLAGRRAEKARR
jgi:transcriptional regulator with XRE-family HTH domain